VSDAIHLSRRTLSKIRQNLTWAFGYNAIGIPLAAGALLPSLGVALTPSLSGALMGLSSLAVMGNSLLLHLEVQGRGGAWRAQHAPAAAAPPAGQQPVNKQPRNEPPDTTQAGAWRLANGGQAVVEEA
jgi:hypothetical protein